MRHDGHPSSRPICRARRPVPELYYWDSFWILEGLYVSGMCETAQASIDNFKWLISEFGFIPNGSRTYYLNRSHPPLFAMICQRFVENCVPLRERAEWVKKVVRFLDQEYLFWSTYRTVELPNERDPSRPFKLNRYIADTDLPRPESFNQDLFLARTLGADQNKSRRLYQQLATGAESGWDFTVRWLAEPTSNLTSIMTTDIIPADLNAIMFRNEKILEYFHDLGGDPAKREEYATNSRLRMEGITAYLESKDGWVDYDFVRKKPLDVRPAIVSNLAELWYGAFYRSAFNNTRIENMLMRHRQLLFGYPGGVPNDEVSSGQQWDFPNVWAPIQFNMITVYEHLGGKAGGETSFWRSKALELAQKFVNTTYCGHQNHGTAIADLAYH